MGLCWTELFLQIEFSHDNFSLLKIRSRFLYFLSSLKTSGSFYISPTLICLTVAYYMSVHLDKDTSSVI